MLKTPYGRFRVIGVLEALSFLVLLGIAMPLKYLGDTPEPVQIVGMLHGVLFMLYLLAIVQVRAVQSWSLGRTLGALVASVLPFGPFVFDRWLRRCERAEAIR